MGRTYRMHGTDSEPELMVPTPAGHIYGTWSVVIRNRISGSGSQYDFQTS